MPVLYNGQRPGLRDRIAGLFGGSDRKDAPQSVMIDRGLPQATWSDRNAKAYFVEGYMLNSAVFACTRALANAFAEPPLLAYEDETKKKAIPNHPVRKLIKRPNEIMGEDEYWKYYITYAVTSGNAYGQIVPSLARIPVQLWPYSDLVMAPVPAGPKWVDHFNYSLDGINVTRIEAELITHFKWAVDPLHPYKGMGALHPVARETDSDNELTRYLKALLQNDAMTRTILTPNGDNTILNKDQMQAMKNEFVSKFGGDNIGSVAVMNKNMNITRVGLNMQELAFDAIRGVPEARIAAAYGVPAIVAGLNIGLARSTYSNFEEARKAFTEQTLVPLWRAVASEFQQSVVSMMGNDVYVDFDLTQVRALSESNTQKSMWVVKAWETNLFTRDRALALLGEETIGGAVGGQLASDSIPAPAPFMKQLGDGLETKAAEAGKKQAAIEKQIKERVEGYLSEQYDAIAKHVEA